MSDIDDTFVPLLAIVKDRSRRLELLELENIRLAARFANKHPKDYALFLGRLSAWEHLSFFKTQVTRRSAANKRLREEEVKNAEAMERLAKADKEGFHRIAESNPRSVARDFIAQAMPNLVYYSREWFEHRVNVYGPIEPAVVRSHLARWMEGAVNDQTGLPVLVNKRAQDEVMDAITSLTIVPSTDAAPPLWLSPQQGDPEPRDLLAARNGLVNVNTGEVTANTSRLFNLNALAYDYEDPCFVLPPDQWLDFLEQLWPDDEGGAESKELLQEWMGLMLTTETRYQKMLLLLGPKRSGKGTITRMLTDLVGKGNIANTSLNRLGREFGRQGLIGKSVMVVSDMRMGSSVDAGATTEYLLNLVGEDQPDVPRKFLPDWTGGLNVRVMLVGNLRPRLPDQAGALAQRYLPLVLTKDFSGREDLFLGEKLKAELPAILLWALKGLLRLRARGHFVQTEAGRKLLDDIRTHASPIKMFLAERCVLGAGLSVAKDELFDAYVEWADESDVHDRHDISSFAQDLFTAGDNTIGKARLGREVRVHVFTGVDLRPEFHPATP